MDEEIDLQKYILLLINSWKWIAGITILFAIVAALVSLFVLSPSYEARAFIVITQPRYSLTFDQKFQTDTNTDLNFYKPVAQIAETDELMQTLFDAWVGQGGNSGITVEKLRSMTTVETTSTTNALELVVTAAEAEVASKLVNLWAELFVQKANEIFGENVEGTDAIQTQFAQVVTGRESAQQALIEFEAGNELNIARANLNNKQSRYNQYLADQTKINQTLQDVETFSTQLADLPANQAVSFDVELAALLLQLKAYNLDASFTQVQIDAQPSETPRTARELTTQLEQMREALNAKSAEISLQLVPLESEILLLQGQIKELETTGERLQQDYQVASDSYITLARKLEETQISSQISGETVQLASGAIVPQEPVGPRKTINTLVGAAIGFFGAIFGIFAYDFWKNLPKESDEASQEDALQGKPVKA